MQQSSACLQSTSTSESQNLDLPPFLRHCNRSEILRWPESLRKLNGNTLKDSRTFLQSCQKLPKARSSRFEIARTSVVAPTTYGFHTFRFSNQYTNCTMASEHRVGSKRPREYKKQPRFKITVLPDGNALAAGGALYRASQCYVPIGRICVAPESPAPPSRAPDRNPVFEMFHVPSKPSF